MRAAQFNGVVAVCVIFAYLTSNLSSGEIYRCDGSDDFLIICEGIAIGKEYRNKPVYGIDPFLSVVVESLCCAVEMENDVFAQRGIVCLGENEIR